MEMPRKKPKNTTEQRRRGVFLKGIHFFCNLYLFLSQNLETFCHLLLYINIHKKGKAVKDQRTGRIRIERLYNFYTLLWISSSKLLILDLYLETESSYCYNIQKGIGFQLKILCYCFNVGMVFFFVLLIISVCIFCLLLSALIEFRGGPLRIIVVGVRQSFPL